MTKPKLCKWEKEPCQEERINYPNKSILAPYCRYHLALSHIYKQREEVSKDKEELEKVRTESKKGTPRQRFYSSTAWKNFSQYILLLYSDENLEVRCSTDPSLSYRVNDKRICVGHWQKAFDGNSTNYSVAFCLYNVAPQSVQQNIHFSGNMPEMEKFLRNKWGDELIDSVLVLKHEPMKLDKDTLDEIAKKYLKLKKDLLIERGLKDPWKFRR